MSNKKDYIHSLDFIKKLSSKKNGEKINHYPTNEEEAC